MKFKTQHGKVAPLTDGYTINAEGRLDFHLLLAALADCKDAPYGSALFHATIAEGLITWTLNAATQYNINYIALGGGCFLNNVLSNALIEGLSTQNMRVLTAQQLPPNDGGISFGQASVAIQHSLIIRKT